MINDQISAMWRIFINVTVVFTKRKVINNNNNLIKSDHAISTEPRKHAYLT